MKSNRPIYYWNLFLVPIFFLSCESSQSQTSKSRGQAFSPIVVQQNQTSTAPQGEQVVCPVCGLRFSSSEAAATHTHDGTIYYFLLEDHQKAFKENPKMYTVPKEAPTDKKIIP